jgi:hypothetical protein
MFGKRLSTPENLPELNSTSPLPLGKHRRQDTDITRARFNRDPSPVLRGSEGRVASTFPVQNFLESEQLSGARYMGPIAEDGSILAFKQWSGPVSWQRLRMKPSHLVFELIKDCPPLRDFLHTTIRKERRIVPKRNISDPSTPSLYLTSVTWRTVPRPSIKHSKCPNSKTLN